MASQYPALSEALGVPLRGGKALIPIPVLNLLKSAYYLEGEYRGRKMKVHNFSRGSGENSNSYHGINVSLNQRSEMTFQLVAEGFFMNVGKAFGMQDIETGDAAFDAAFIVKCSDPGFVGGALLPEIRQQFLSIKDNWRRWGSLKLKHSVLTYEQSGYLRKDEDRERAIAMAAALSDLAAAIEVYSAGS